MAAARNRVFGVVGIVVVGVFGILRLRDFLGRKVLAAGVDVDVDRVPVFQDGEERLLRVLPVVASIQKMRRRRRR